MRKALAVLSGLLLLILSTVPVPAAAPDAPKDPKVKPSACFECHDTVEALFGLGKHPERVNCNECHRGIGKHLADPSPETRPFTDLSWAACGGCHKAQYESVLEVARHRPARDEKSQLTGRSPNPFWDKLMMGHGFTKEHNTTRSHAWMLLDQFVVDRAFGGRFQPKDGWQYVLADPSTPLWDIITDTQPGNDEHKPFLPQTAAAVNPTCFQCKTQDQILDWAFLGDPKAASASWNRASNPVQMGRSLKQPFNCIICHDPHAARPRIVRDALIETLSRPDGTTVWHRDPKRTGFTVYDLGERGHTRRIAILDRYDTRLQCAQCHVEYNCNAGTDPATGQPVKYDDPRTNFIPFTDVFGVYDAYVGRISFLDFRHALTGGLLWKAQHPEAETFYASKMALAGVRCEDCHTPKIKASGWSTREHTSHFAVTPKVMLKDTCLRCHKDWDEERAGYVVDSVKAHVRGKLRKAEFWLDRLIDRIVEARKAGLDPAAIGQAQDQHLRAHILWEWWTAENSDGFHNPAMARESLTRSVDESQKGIKILADAAEAAAKKQ